MRIEILPVHDADALGTAWRALEAEAEGLSFFQSWTWIGCLAAERFPDPVLLRAVAADGERTLGLALFNRRRGRLCLAESGEAVLDAPFTEHNAPLLAAGPAAPAVRRALLRAAWTVRGARRLVLGGAPPELAEEAGGTVLRRQLRAAPRIDLAAVREGPAGGDYLATLSANARYQIRRSIRRYAARGGAAALAAAAAATEAEALAWFDAMAGLHAATWARRGQPGAFAHPFMRRFHAALIGRALPRGELDLLRIAPAGAAGPVAGYLYNFRLRGWVHAYQSGFDPGTGSAQDKPGLACHAVAVQRAIDRGDAVYDFLAGDSRYKRSLARDERMLAWTELVPAWSVMGVAARAARALGRR